MKKILFINFGGIGDEILFLPTIQSFKKKYNDSEITLMLESRSKSILSIAPVIDKLICADIKKSGFYKYLEILKALFKIWKEKYDIVVASGKSPFIAVFLFLTGIETRIGYKSKNEKTNKLLTKSVELDENQYAGTMYHNLIEPLVENAEFEIPKIELEKPNTVDDILGEKLLSEGFIALHPGVSLMSIKKHIYKCPNVDFWANLINKVSDMGKNVVLLGGPDDEDVVKNISSKTNKFTNLYGKTKSFTDFAKVINKAEKFICVDSAPMHLAVSLDKEIIAIFGPTNEEKLIPKKDKFHVITSDIDCRPCLWHLRQSNCTHSKCLDIDINEILKFL